jgi:hypothetical protein
LCKENALYVLVKMYNSADFDLNGVTPEKKDFDSAGL